MTGYRVAEEPPADPFAVDTELCRTQFFNEKALLHFFLTLFTLGFWLPGLVWALSGAAARRVSTGYSVRMRRGALTIGNATDSSSIPLDTIDSVQVQDGKVRVRQGSARGQVLFTIYGLRDPRAAADAILDAREAYLRPSAAEPAYAEVEGEAARRRARG